jgi:hypothetical protein
MIINYKNYTLTFYIIQDQDGQDITKDGLTECGQLDFITGSVRYQMVTIPRQVITVYNFNKQVYITQTLRLMLLGLLLYSH